MAARDEAIDALRRARPDLPDHLASPTSAAAQALLEEILSMQIIDEPEVDLEVEASPSPERPRRRLVLVAAASVVAFAAAALVAMQAVGGDGTSDTVRLAPSTTPPEAAGRSGRIEVTREVAWATAPVFGNTVAYEFSGDDVRIGSTADGQEYREVNGQAWLYEIDESYVPTAGESPDMEDRPNKWFFTNLQAPGPHDLEPATLLDDLGAAGPFEPVGDEDVAGVVTHRQRATRPDQATFGDLNLEAAYQDGAVTGLEVWVDDEGLVRRLDVTREGVQRTKPYTETLSLVWSDLGEPITIEVPPVG